MKTQSGPNQNRGAPKSAGFAGEPWKKGICNFYPKGKCTRDNCNFVHMTPEAYKQREADFKANTLDLSAPIIGIDGSNVGAGGAK